MDWTDDQVVRLRRWWAEGLVANEIANRLNCSRNSVIGKAHRLKLTRRPSPIHKKGTPQPPRAPSVRKATLAIVVAPIHVIAPPVSVVADLPLRKPVRPCCWPMWGDKAPVPRPALFCAAESVPGKVYCVQHCRIAYVRLPVRHAA